MADRRLCRSFGAAGVLSAGAVESAGATAVVSCAAATPAIAVSPIAISRPVSRPDRVNGMVPSPMRCFWAGSAGAGAG